MEVEILGRGVGFVIVQLEGSKISLSVRTEGLVFVLLLIEIINGMLGRDIDLR